MTTRALKKSIDIACELTIIIVGTVLLLINRIVVLSLLAGLLSSNHKFASNDTPNTYIDTYTYGAGLALRYLSLPLSLIYV